MNLLINQPSVAFLTGSAFGYLMAAGVVWFCCMVKFNISDVAKQRVNKITVVLVLLAAITIFFASKVSAQYIISDMEYLCAEQFSEQQVSDCTHSQRVNLGLYTPEQFPQLMELHRWYREQAMWDNARDLTHRLRWLVGKNDSYGVLPLVEALVWYPDGECFERDELMYTDWSRSCEELRYYVVDCYIMASEIAEASEEWAAFARLAEITAHLLNGVTGEPMYVFDHEYRQQLNLSIPNQYRADLWMMRSTSARGRL